MHFKSACYLCFKTCHSMSTMRSITALSVWRNLMRIATKLIHFFYSFPSKCYTLILKLLRSTIIRKQGIFKLHCFMQARVYNKGKCQMYYGFCKVEITEQSVHEESSIKLMKTALFFAVPRKIKCLSH